LLSRKTTSYAVCSSKRHFERINVSDRDDVVRRLIDIDIVRDESESRRTVIE
jgi:hypothetical protein